MLPESYTNSPTTTSAPSGLIPHAVATNIATAFICIIVFVVGISLIRKLCICIYKASAANCRCSWITNHCVQVVCESLCCFSIEELPGDDDVPVEVSTSPPAYDIALSMPKPVHDNEALDTVPKPLEAGAGVDNDGFELDDSQLPSYDDALHLQQTAIHSINNPLNHGGLPTIEETVVEIDTEPTRNPPGEEVSTESEHL
ncbi:hypothetical protein CAPTEDRAFT_195604 [Capitella teleta]|uniref:Uncharacterized protein n=1 Tax=Capitella teleta TaxID=283909 RepID=R7UIU5_CAPTE|nr:hypothetical protein CAPTEDRAFT_195604 [Capitella teleta]|eukprot:ELU03207.1 hypothetical protein CAPTEDRAFT_195604 [Capitella teleta]